ncbi:MAG: cell division protein FtsQ/DivIB [Prochlorothrix sp.]|nr:FtsQ-type POTRA domain-containing protein [Prochlorothrix sp.]
MNPVSPVTAQTLADRRQQLKRQRTLKVLSTLWRTTLVSGMAAGVVWSMTRPLWLLRTPDQVKVQGNEFLSAEMIRSLMPLNYPVSLLKVRPETIQASIAASEPIRHVRIIRTLLPPQLTIEVQERRPVAQVIQPGPPGSNAQSWEIMGLLDDRGFWLDRTELAHLNSNVPLPSLTVLGQRDDYRTLWPPIYQTLQQSPVAVQQVDWRDSNNLILHTDLGLVHCGPFGTQFQTQLAVLDRMRDLANHPEKQNLAYIDLSRPNAPYLQMAVPATPPKQAPQNSQDPPP